MPAIDDPPGLALEPGQAAKGHGGDVDLEPEPQLDLPRDALGRREPILDLQ